MIAMLRRAVIVALALACAACASFPDRAYYPDPARADTMALSKALWRAARAAGDDPRQYSFAMIHTQDVSAYTADDAVFYFSEGLARQPARVMEALIAHEVAHELLGHAGRRRVLSLSLSAGFTVLGIAVPGAGLLDLLVNPLIVRAYTRDQETAADLKAVEVLRSMGDETPRRTLAEALTAAAKVNGTPRGGIFASEPDLADRLSAIEPLEGAAEAALRPAGAARR
jgi:Zn-dependent protease with chaperone function